MSAAARPRTRKTSGGSRGGRSGGDGSGATVGRNGWWARLPRSLRRSLIALGVLLVLYLVRVPLLVGMAKLLVIDDEPGRADMIVMLGGNLDFRPPKVAELYREGVAKRVILARVQDLPAEQMLVYPNETDAAVKMLGMLGVPDSAITVLRTPGGVTSTVDEAKALRAYLEPRGPATVVLVTSLPHTRRAEGTPCDSADLRRQGHALRREQLVALRDGADPVLRRVREVRAQPHLPLRKWRLSSPPSSAG
jgi:uncharacterized SAM-binding protein YcdF (DUF218 family)